MGSPRPLFRCPSACVTLSPLATASRCRSTTTCRSRPGQPAHAADFTEQAVAGLPDLHAHLNLLADDLAERLREAHLRVREAAGQRVRRQITVRAQKPADVLGVYVYLPTAPGGAR